MAKFVVFKGFFQYDVVNLFAEELATALTELNHDVSFLDGRSSTIQQDLQTTLTSSVDYAISFNGAGSGFDLMKSNTDSIYEKLDIKFIAILLDHPSHHLPRLDGTNTFITSYDYSHIEYLNTIFNQSKKIAFLPHGGNSSKTPQNKPFSEREIPCLFAGTFINPNQQFEQLKTIPNPVIRNIIMQSIEPLFSSDGVPMETIITRLAQELKIDLLEEVAIYREFTSYIRLLDVFIKGYKRLQTLSKLDDHGIPVTIIGNNWPPQQFSNHQIMLATSYDKILELMTNSKLVMNMGLVPNGSHERVFSASLNGAVVLSDYNPYFASTFNDAILLYKFSELELLPELIKKALANTDQLETMAKKATFISQQHTWKQRGQELQAILKNDWRI